MSPTKNNMSIKEIVKKYIYFKRESFSLAVFGSHAEYDEWHNRFNEKMLEVFQNLTPDERMELFKQILSREKLNLEDNLTEFRVEETLESIMIIQVFKQLAGE